MRERQAGKLNPKRQKKIAWRKQSKDTEWHEWMSERRLREKNQCESLKTEK